MDYDSREDSDSITDIEGDEDIDDSFSDDLLAGSNVKICSNENQSSLPFDLNSHLSFISMHDKLRPFVVPPILLNGKRSARKMKLVTIQLFVRDGVGELESQSGRKNSKVRVL